MGGFSPLDDRPDHETVNTAVVVVIGHVDRNGGVSVVEASLIMGGGLKLGSDVANICPAHPGG